MSKPRIDIPLNRELMAMAARSSGDDQQFVELAKDLVDPKYQKISTIDLLRRHRLSMARFVEQWRHYHHLTGMMSIADQMPALYSDMVEDARSYEDICPTCNMGEEQRRCPRCNKTGKIRKPGDTAARRMLMEMMGVITKSGGGKSILALQQNISGGGASPISLEETGTLVGKLLDHHDKSE